MAEFDFNAQWQNIMNSSPLSDTATIDGAKVKGFFFSGTYLDKKGANFAPTTPIEKRSFVVSSAEFEVRPEKLKGKKVEVNGETYIVLQCRGAESGVYRMELERMKA